MANSADDLRRIREAVERKERANAFAVLILLVIVGWLWFALATSPGSKCKDSGGTWEYDWDRRDYYCQK